MIKGDITFISDDLVSFDSCKVFAGGNAAVATYTRHSKFEYKGTPNDDIAKFSAVLEKVGGQWKMVHGQRATGQAPKPKS